MSFEIDSREAFNRLISAVEEEELLENGMMDISRELFFKHEIEFYHVTTHETVPITKDTDTEIATPSFEEKKEAGEKFEIGKKEWVKRKIRGIVNSMISNVIERYEYRFGTNRPPGDNIGSIDWLIRVLKITLIQVAEEMPEYVKKTIEDLEMRRDLAKTDIAKERIQAGIDILKAEYGGI